jgi:PAS domain S-box-containing protein
LDPNLKFLDAKGELPALIRNHDWSGSPLGPPAKWPASLRTLVGFMLTSRFPMFLVWGDELTCLYNDAYAPILGTKHPAALGRRFQEVWFEIWEDIRPLVEQALSGEAVYHENLPLTMLRKGYEEQAYFTFTYSPVRDEAGEIGGMFVTCIETTAQVLAERRRLEENVRLHALFQQAPGFMAVVRDPNHVFELANDAYLQVVGYRQLVGKPVREALPELAGQGFFELLDHVYSTGEAYVGRALPAKLQREPGAPLEERFVDFVYQPIKDQNGKVSGIFCEGIDVTESVRATTALRESEQRLRQLANTIPHLTWMAQPDGFVHWYNDRWYEFTGGRLEDMQGWAWTKLFSPDDIPVLVERWERSIATGEPYEATARMRGASGEWRSFFMRASPLRDATGAIVQWFGTNTDVTDLRKAQDELMASNRRKDEFLAMLAHELRNPLAPISAAAELLKLSGNNPERAIKAGEVISRQVRHMTELVDDLLDVSRVTRGLVRLDTQDLDLKAIVANAIEQVRPLIEARRHVLTTRMGAGHIVVHGDRTRLVQAVTNLLGNAAKYTPQGGEIALEVVVQGAQVSIAVKDNGIGIDAGLLPHIFDLFTQAERTPDRAQGGLGIGLALVRSVLVLHGGSIEAHSDGPGKGSTFTITLPLEHQDALPPQAANETLPQTAQALPILIVDDNVDAAQSLAALLQIKGYRVTVSEDGKGALAAADLQSFAACILDIGLPDMTGYALASALRERQSSTRPVFIALTGYGQPDDRALSKAHGFDHHFAKPVDIAQLERVLADVGAG